jgi:hypothetical protein
MNHHGQVVELFKEHFGEREFSGIEIGTCQGLLTKSLLLYFPNLQKLYTIDPYLHDSTSEFEAHRPQEWLNDCLAQAVVALAEYGDRKIQLVMKSDEAVIHTPNLVDFVWVDGDHTISQIERDIINYYPKVKKGGIFGGHDYSPSKYALHNVLPYAKVITGEDLCWWIFKNE